MHGLCPASTYLMRRLHLMLSDQQGQGLRDARQSIQSIEKKSWADEAESDERLNESGHFTRDTAGRMAGRQRSELLGLRGGHKVLPARRARGRPHDTPHEPRPTRAHAHSRVTHPRPPPRTRPPPRGDGGGTARRRDARGRAAPAGGARRTHPRCPCGTTLRGEARLGTSFTRYHT